MTRAQQQAQEQRKAPRPHPLRVARERQEEANNECRAFVAKLNEAVGAEVVKDIRLKQSPGRLHVILSFRNGAKTPTLHVPVAMLDQPIPVIMEALWPKLEAMYPDYKEYRARTEGVRHIPILIFSPV